MMRKPLFIPSKVAEQRQESHSALVEDDADNEFMICKGAAKLQELFPSLQRETNLHYVSHGEWSTHELIMHLLTITGPAHLYFTTWSLKEYPVRLLLEAIEDKRLLSISCILDSRVKARNPEVLQLAKNSFVNCREYDCHAKVFVLETESWMVTMVGSSNMTNNPRVEACVLSTDKAVGHFHKHWITELIKEGTTLDDIHA